MYSTAYSRLSARMTSPSHLSFRITASRDFPLTTHTSFLQMLTDLSRLSQTLQASSVTTTTTATTAHSRESRTQFLLTDPFTLQRLPQQHRNTQRTNSATLQTSSTISTSCCHLSFQTAPSMSSQLMTQVTSLQALLSSFQTISAMTARQR